MKTKIRRMSKRTLALFLGVMMLLTAIGTSVVFAFQRQDFTYVRFVGNDLSGSGFDTSYFTSYNGQNHYTGTWYIKNKNNDYANNEYNYYLKVHGKVKENDSYNYYLSLNNTVFGTGTGEHNGSSDADCVAIYENNGDMTFKTMPTPSGWVAVQVNFWGDYSNNARVGLYQSAVNALTASDKSVNANGGDSVNVMPTIAGGTGGTNRSYTVRDAHGNTISGCMSGDNFTAPYVTEETTYYVDATVTDSNISSLVDTATVTVTVSPKVSNYYVLGASSLTGGKNWNASGWENDSSLKMIQTGSEWYEATFNNVSAGEFKIVYHSGNTTTWYSGSQMNGTESMTTSGNLTSTLSGSDNISLDFEGTANVTIKYKNGTGWVVQAVVNDATAYTTTISDADTEHNYSTAIATASPAETYLGNRVTIATTPKAGYVARVSVKDGSNNSVSTSKSGNNFYFTMPDSNVTATVTYVEATSIPVTVYANSGGSVNVLYGSAVTTIDEGDHNTIQVSEDDTITLTAVPDASHSFSKWFRNLDNNYSTTASISETIDSKRTYVASFGGSAGDTGFDRSTYTTEGTNFSIIYSTGSGGQSYSGSSGTALGGTVWRSGNVDYYIELSSAELEAWKTALGSGQVRWNLFYNNSTTQITDKNGYDVRYYDTSTSALKTCEDNNDSTLLIKSKPEDYSSNVFIELSKIDSTIGSLGIHINTSNKKVDYYFGTSGGEGSDEYIPSTNFYAKDSSVRDSNYNLWIYSPKTTVTAVTDQVRIDEDHTDNRKWVEGYAMKGTEITVTSIIPHRGKYKYTDRSGHSGDGDSDFKYADEKYYVAGFSFNGVTPELLSEDDGVAVTGVDFYNYNSSGTYTSTTTTSGVAYTCTYKIPVDMKEAKLEITPIIFVKDEYASESVMVYINGYNEPVKDAGWGNTLYLYPFYKYNDATYYGQAENFGRYPGQPVINYGGQLFAQIPLTDDASKNGKDNNGGPIKGITINNGYYDDVHRTYCNHVSVHRQTYDYDDFAKIYNEKKTKNNSKYLYSIYFSFKYKEKDPSKQHRLASTTNAIDADGDASRYNDLLTSSGILSNTSGTVSSSTLITAGENSGGWEDLEDSLGNNVDIFGNKVTNASAEPLRVFSLGYEYNNAGRWATEWAVYHKSGDNYVLVQDPSKTGAESNKYSMVVPSALIFNDKSSLSSATSMDGDLAVNTYAGIYEALEDYRGVPVKICYEYDIPDAFSPNNYRCDGRWTYTTVDDYVRSNIKIQYYDKDGVLQDDTFGEGTNVGTTTGCSAYFTNSAYYGATQSDSEIIDSSESYKFKAEAKGSYEFVGWYMYDTAGHESTITKSSTSADTPRSGNFTLAARFKYVASGKLTISNSLKSNSTGRGTTYLGVTVKNGDKETVVANVNSNTDPVTLDNSYINSSSNYKILVDIRTVPIGENTFNEYTCYTTDGHTGTDVRSDASDDDIYDTSDKTNTTAHYEITVKGDIFDSTTTTQQNVKAIEYESELNAVTYHYDVKYWFMSRQYGKQAMTKSGNLSVGQINDETIVDKGTSGSATGKALKNKFLTQIMPHESNFNEKIVWDFDKAGNVTQSVTKDAGTNTFNFTVTVGVLIDSNNNNSSGTETQSTEIVKRTGYFTVPYAQTNGVADADGSGKVYKTDETTFEIEVNYDELFYTSGTSFVTAPAVIYETVGGVEKARNFKYWEMSTASSSRGDSRVVGKCFFPEFNYRALDNYNIRAVYSENDDDHDTYGSLYASEDEGKTSIAFIGNTRNQWNNNDKGSASYYAGDLIYNDFIFSFKPIGDTLFMDLDSAECGMVIQRLKEIETNSSGTNAKTLQEYAKDYTAADLTAAQDAAKTKAGGNNAAGYTQIKVAFDKSNINSKNRYHYAYSMFNSAQKTSGAEVTSTYNAKYLYRAYSYMKIGNGEYILSDEPTYFYMYDIANE